eukprot:3567790-Pyramimonas_sp.AAC.1
MGSHGRAMRLFRPACGWVLDLRKLFVCHEDRQREFNTMAKARSVDLRRQLSPVQTISNSGCW